MKDGTPLPTLDPERASRSFVRAIEAFSAEEIQAAIQEAAHSVVRIRVKATASLRYPNLDDDGFGYLEVVTDETQLTGSGFVIDADGSVVTNAHVAAPFGAGAGVSVDTTAGESYPAKLVGFDEASDLAVLRIEAGKLPPLNWGDSEKVYLGEETWALGNPLDIGFSMTRGNISSMLRTRVGMNQVENFLHSDAFFTSGNSGGPLVSARGLVLGVNDMGYSGFKSQGYSIPSRMARLVTEKILAQGAYKRGFLGLQVRPLDSESARKHSIKRTSGVMVETVLPGFPAVSAGFRPGDLIFGINGHGVPETYLLQEAISSVGPEAPLTILVDRAGQTVSLPVTTTLRPPSPRIDPVLDLQRYLQAEFLEDSKKNEVLLRIVNNFSLAAYYGFEDGQKVESVLVAKNWPTEVALRPEVYRASHPQPIQSLGDLRQALGGMYLGGRLGVAFSMKSDRVRLVTLVISENWAIIL
ncbi:MAG: S1C family serine protease [Acidobacteria bacterium]|nr:S1C family serine protease [Acidobacteriota bacterium]